MPVTENDLRAELRSLAAAPPYLDDRLGGVERRVGALRRRRSAAVAATATLALAGIAAGYVVVGQVRADRRQVAARISHWPARGNAADGHDLRWLGYAAWAHRNLDTIPEVEPPIEVLFGQGTGFNIGVNPDPATLVFRAVDAAGRTHLVAYFSHDGRGFIRADVPVAEDATLPAIAYLAAAPVDVASSMVDGRSRTVVVVVGRPGTTGATVTLHDAAGAVVETRPVPLVDGAGMLDLGNQPYLTATVRLADYGGVYYDGLADAAGVPDLPDGELPNLGPVPAPAGYRSMSWVTAGAGGQATFTTTIEHPRLAFGVRCVGTGRVTVELGDVTYDAPPCDGTLHVSETYTVPLGKAVVKPRATGSASMWVVWLEPVSRTG